MVPNFNMMKTVTLLVHAGLFSRFHNPPNSDIDYRIFNMHMWSFLHVYTHAGPEFTVSCKGLTSPVDPCPDARYCSKL